MTIPEQNNNPIVEISIPVSTQQALEKVNATKSAWLEARRQQKAAADNIATIRQRRAEMEATTNALNEEWRTLFRESQGVVSKEMKKLRTEIALGRETLEDFDELLAAQESEKCTFAAGGCGISRKVYPRARHPCGYSRKTNLGRFYAVAWKSTNPDTKPAQINNGQGSQRSCRCGAFS